MNRMVDSSTSLFADSLPRRCKKIRTWKEVEVEGIRS